jgi:uncharacterized RDD family membrane protein YckC
MSTRAAAAAARVAARYANAPSYSEQLANEARAALRAAEAASKAALEAQATAQSVLDVLEAAGTAEAAWELQPPQVDETESDRNGEKAHARTTSAPQIDRRAARTREQGHEYEIHWEPDMPARQTEPAEVRRTHGDGSPETAPEGMTGEASDAIETVEPGQPIHANLIQFPREIVATRKVRPRLAEGRFAEFGGQLSIFEVDPGSISVEPAAADQVNAEVAPEWTGPEWSGIQLDAQPRPEFLMQTSVEAQKETTAAAGLPDEIADGEPRVVLAPMRFRLMAGIVNGSLVMGAFVTATAATAFSLKNLPSPRVIEVGAVAALAVIALLYHFLFYAFSKGTPGMRYAGVSLCTFEGMNLTRRQRFERLAAMLLSVVPMGLGVVWAIFDEDRLTWHDRLSKTYLRKN